ncbi:zinc finger protein 79-like [Copidosoma floridanum]|uniref:zinc finger protein 79-like n=1 Tax=Copidosoma floridanum TaxID=29053 RepID=UPI0006C981AC|nr:zinc finger protein 79-like [Copidosoma floridanum]
MLVLNINWPTSPDISLETLSILNVNNTVLLVGYSSILVVWDGVQLIINLITLSLPPPFYGASILQSEVMSVMLLVKHSNEMEFPRKKVFVLNAPPAAAYCPPRNNPSQPQTSNSSPRASHGCSMCPQAFDAPSSLTRHLRTHTGDKRHACPTCTRRFAENADLRKHMYVHTGERPYRCSDCDRAFTNPSNLARHKRTHTNERPYNCRECQKCFANPSNLARHERVHTGERPYSCPVCRAGFATSGVLARHQVTHTGEKAFRCDLCRRVYADSRNLRMHVAHVHKTSGGACDAAGVVPQAM